MRTLNGMNGKTFCSAILILFIGGNVHAQLTQQYNQKKQSAQSGRPSRAPQSSRASEAAQSSKPQDKASIQNSSAKGNVSAPTIPAVLKTASHIVTISGDFSSLRNSLPLNHKLVAAVAAGDLEIAASNQVDATLISNSELTIAYKTAVDAPPPTTVYLGTSQADTPFPFILAHIAPSDPNRRRLVLSGDFCRPESMATQASDKTGCGTKLLSDPASSTQDITGYVYSADGTGYTPITVNVLQAHSADVEFSADPNFRPSWVALEATKSPDHAIATFAYVPAVPETTTGAVYTTSAPICKADAPTASGIPCIGSTVLVHSLSPEGSEKVDVISVRDHLLFVKVTGRTGELPETLSVEGESGQSQVARLVHRPADDQSLLSVSFMPVDQETAHRDFGAYIAQHYLAIELRLSNRTAKSLQFNKSAIWFDVDFSDVGGHYKKTAGQIASLATADLVPLDPYNSLFSTWCKSKDGSEIPCGRYRFGIEQNVRVTPVNYSTILDVYDANSERLDRMLKYVELFGGVLNTIATGGVVAQVSNSAFKDSAQILTGSFLPGFRAVTQDLPGTDRLRKNLVNETFQEVVQISPHAHSSTIVLLPRDAMLAFQGYERMAVIDRVLNVHIDPDILNGVKDPPVPANHVEIGYTKDQVRQSLGEPPNVSTESDGSTTYNYTSGPYSKVNFDAKGMAISWDPRSVNDQLTSAATLDTARGILRANSITSTYLQLQNGHSILVDIPGLTNALQYDSSGKHIEDYALLYPQIKAEVGQTRDSFQTFLGSKQQPAASSYLPLISPGKNDKTLIFAMPDVIGGQILATFSDAPVENTKATITSITFQGPKPAVY